MPIFSLPYFDPADLKGRSISDDLALQVDHGCQSVVTEWPPNLRVLVVSGIPLLPSSRVAGNEWNNPLAELMGEWLHGARQHSAHTFVAQFAGPYESVAIAPNSYQTGLNRLAHALRDTIPVINRSGARLAVAVHQEHFLTSPPEARELLDQTLCPRYGAAMVVGPDDEQPLLADWIETLGRRLFAVIVKNEAWNSKVWATTREFLEARLSAENCPADLLIPAALW